MELLIKAAVIGTAGALLSLLIKKNNPEMSLMLAMAVGVMVIGMALELVTGVMEVIDLATETSGLSPAVLKPVLKGVGIGVITRLAADLCRDAGQSSIASSVELVGAVCALYVSLPLIKTLLIMIGEFL
ncbi:MAG: SpoIIIAC/SpoIIIAD family protein [Oscillospiraceae bacterium]|jgi:stage III sporulation protein AD